MAQRDTNEVELPAPTVMPMVLALGLSLILTGLVTNLWIGILGALLVLWAGVGWFRQVIPHENHVTVPALGDPFQAFSARTLQERPIQGAMHRKILPIESFNVMTGVKGGAVGGVAMVIPAALYSFLRYHSVWYAPNLLAAGGFVSWVGASNAFLSEFHLQGLLAAMVIHGFTSLLVGLLYGAMLPMYPKYPILTAGLVVPLLFTAILHSAVGVISPILNQRIDWFWFFVSQIAFGLVCGYVVDRHARIRTPQYRALPFSVRAGIESDEDTRQQQQRTKGDARKDSSE